MSRYRDRGAYTAPARVTERRAGGAQKPLSEAGLRESLVRGYMLGALPVVGEGARAEMIEGLRMAAEGG